MDEEVKVYSSQENLHTAEIKRILIHARGCTASRLIRGSQDAGIEVVLVASDPDMESYPTTLLSEKTTLYALEVTLHRIVI